MFFIVSKHFHCVCSIVESNEPVVISVVSSPLPCVAAKVRTTDQGEVTPNDPSSMSQDVPTGRLQGLYLSHIKEKQLQKQNTNYRMVKSCLCHCSTWSCMGIVIFKMWIYSQTDRR